MAIMTDRGDVKREILRLIDGVDDAEFTRQIDHWFDMGLRDVYSRLRAWWAVRAAVSTIQEDGTIILPPSYLEMMTVFPLSGGDPLTPVTPDQAGPMFGWSGPPTHYLLEGVLMTILPLQTSPLELRFTYYSKLNPLIGDNDSSFYITEAGSALMYSGGYHANSYREDAGGVKMCADAAAARIQTINEESFMARTGSGIVMQRSR